MNLIYLALLCGLIATSFVPRSEARLHAESIVGGNTAVLGQSAYAVSVQFNGENCCSGGILNNLYVVTAAHCFIDDENNRFYNVNFIVVAGAHQAHYIHEPYRQERAVAQIYVPREFNPTRDRVADIAVLQLTAALVLGPHHYVTHVVLPPNPGPHPTYVNMRAIVSGYGHNWAVAHRDPHTNEITEVCTGSHCYERRFAEVDIISNNACHHFFHDITDSHLCGRMVQRSPTHPEGLCTGDSGGPLVIGDTIIGVVIVSPEGCWENEEPAMYTRITSFIPFIINAMNGRRTPHMRLARYEVGRRHTRVLVER